ncbi:phosphopantetheine-binding protein [Metabacillus fastidiosus]|uniref:phosphopantetheine-binding protein n=1 Tax=Metabacillus fastidiosus TaxID=1458 RepID=UPI003D2BFA0A
MVNARPGYLIELLGVILVKTKLSEIFEELEVNQDYNSKTSLVDMGIDSLKTMELIVLIEEKFNLFIPDEKLSGEYFETVGTLESLISQELSKNN